jgi:ketosteroid isomerase-like protein
MKRRAPIVALLAGFFMLGLPGLANAKDEETVKQTVFRLEQAWTDAIIHKDAAALGKILADDWFGFGPSGTTTRAKALVEVVSPDSTVESQTLRDVKVRVFGDVAVFTCSYDEKSSSKGKDTSVRFLSTDVFVKRNGQWQAVASQATLMKPTG